VTDTAPAIVTELNAPAPVGPAPLVFQEFVFAEPAAFRVEFCWRGRELEDLIAHFYPTDPDVLRDPRYWDDIFPRTLNDFAQAHFSAGSERLAAGRVADCGIMSWWFTAKGYGNDPFITLRVTKFFEGLNALLLPFVPPRA